MYQKEYNHTGGVKVRKGDIDRLIDDYPKQYATPKYLLFIQWAIEQQYRVTLYMPATTRSKYVTLYRGKKLFKIRFSDHRPIKAREEKGDCDFFVGRTNFTVTTTEDAKQAVRNFFFPSRSKHELVDWPT
jgi:hypothetical protein